MKHVKEEDIIEWMRRQDRRCIEALYDRYADALYGVILNIIRDEARAQDILQESFIKIWKKSNQYEPTRSRLFTWLLAICRNTAIDQLRILKNKAGSEIQTDDSAVYNIAVSGIVPDHIDVKDVLTTLDTKYREVIDVLYFQGMTQKEASEYLGIPLGTVKTRLKIGLRSLRNIFQVLLMLLLILM